MTIWRSLTQELSLKLFSLGAALVLFMFVSVENSTPVDVDFRIEYHLADDMLITNDAPTVLHTTLQGPWAAFRSFEMASMPPLQVDLMNAGPGSVRHSIAMRDVHAPGGMKMVFLHPSELEVVLDRRVERQVPVHADIPEGPAFGYEVLDVRVVPARVRVVGPGSRMQALEYISTRTIDIKGREQELSLEVDLRPPPPPMRLLDKRVTVFVEIAEELAQRTLVGVPVVLQDAPRGASYAPDAVTFNIKGPRRLIDRIDAHALSAQVTPGEGLAAGGSQERPATLVQDLPERTQLVAPVPKVTVVLPPARKLKKRL